MMRNIFVDMCVHVWGVHVCACVGVCVHVWGCVYMVWGICVCVWGV